jgi:hypothetical protein
MMASSEIDLCSLALLKIGANSIASFEEGTAEAEVAASLYPSVRDALISAHPWNFALAQRTLAKLANKPTADFANAFQLPPDCVHVLSAGTQGRGRGLEYRISERHLHTNAEVVILTYLYRPNETDFPPFFDMALIARLAAEFCIPLTDSTSRWEGLRKYSEEEFRRAKLIDSQEDAAPRFDDFTLIEVRR